MDYAMTGTGSSGQGNSGPATVRGSLVGPGPFQWGATSGVYVIVDGWDVNI
jgi:hypothetical protein